MDKTIQWFIKEKFRQWDDRFNMEYLEGNTNYSLPEYSHGYAIGYREALEEIQEYTQTKRIKRLIG